jgi:topoisomerase-4 subunit B
MSPCRRCIRIDVGKQVFYALDDAERQGVLDRIAAEKLKGKVSVQRFKGLGEMNPSQLRETTIHPIRAAWCSCASSAGDETNELLDMLLAKNGAAQSERCCSDWRRTFWPSAIHCRWLPRNTGPPGTRV